MTTFTKQKSEHASEFELEGVKENREMQIDVFVPGNPTIITHNSCEFGENIDYNLSTNSYFESLSGIQFLQI